MKKRHMAFALVVACSATFWSAAASEAHKFVISGVVLDQGRNQLAERFIQWLSRASDYPLTFQYVDKYQALTDTLEKNESAIGWTCGAPFVEDHAKYQQKLVAVPLFRGAAEYHSLVVTRRGRTEKTLSAFKGQVFAYSDVRSSSAFVAPSFALKQQGVDIKQHFRYLMNTGLHENAIGVVLAGQADVANINEYILVEYFRSHPESRQHLAVLEKLGPLPFTPIVAAHGVSDTTIHRLQSALISMHQDPVGAEILNDFGLDGFVIKQPAYYQPIATMLEALGKPK